MKLIAGLGNPGVRYVGTRHNVGFRVVEAMSEEKGVKLDRYLFRALYGVGRIGPEEVVLVKPLTYMNRSGEAVAPLLGYFGLSPENLLVIYDDVALPLGRLRLRARGSAGGHKGIESIITSLGTEEFPRLRIGIDSPPAGMDMPTYVLENFLPEEEEGARQAVIAACRALGIIVAEGLAMAMNRVNSPDFVEPAHG